jgi:antitoxin CptB
MPAAKLACDPPADIARHADYMTSARHVRAFGVGMSGAAGGLADEEPMTGTTRSSEGLDLRRRKLLFRSWHRGLREMDLIMGGFADARLAQLDAGELADFERLIEVPDRDLLAWIMGEETVPPDFDSALFRALRDFHLNPGGGG